MFLTMRFLSFVALGASLVHAQSSTTATSTASSSSSSTSSSAVPTHTIHAGALGQFLFTPNVTTADVGDMIGMNPNPPWIFPLETHTNISSEFRFYPQNHSVAQAAFGQACIPYSLSGLGRQGFWSNFFPVAVYDGSAPGFQVRVNDTDPIFFYCAAPDACTGDGMVGVINPNATETFAIQHEFALNATVQIVPGEGFPSEGGSSTSATASATSTSTPTSTASASKSHKSKLSSGAIAGIVVSGVVVIALAGALFYLCGRTRSLSQLLNLKHSSGLVNHQSPPGQFSPASQWSRSDKPHADMTVNPMGHRQPPSEMGDDSHLHDGEARWSNSTAHGSSNLNQRRSPSPSSPQFVNAHDAYDNGMQSIPEALRYVHSPIPFLLCSESRKLPLFRADTDRFQGWPRRDG